MSCIHCILIVIFLAGSCAQQACRKEHTCDWPISQKGDISQCRCPSGFLNIEDTCCLDQWWIIGLSLGAGFILLVVILTLIGISVVMGKANKKTEKLLVLNQSRLHDIMNLKEENKEEEKTTEEEERGKEASQGNKRNVGTDPMETYIPDGNNYTTIQYPQLDHVEYRNQAYQNEEDEFQRQSRVVMNKRRFNLLGYQPTAMVSNEVATAAHDRRSLSPPSFDPTQAPAQSTLSPNNTFYNQPHPHRQPLYHDPYYGSSPNRQNSEFIIKRPTLKEQ